MRGRGRLLSDGRRTWNRSAFDAGRPHSGKGFQDMHAVSLHHVGSANVLVCVDVSEVGTPCCGEVPALAGRLCWIDVVGVRDDGWHPRPSHAEADGQPNSLQKWAWAVLLAAAAPMGESGFAELADMALGR